MVGMIYSCANFVVYIASYYNDLGIPLTPVEEEILYFAPYGLRCLTIIPGVWITQNYSSKL